MAFTEGLCPDIQQSLINLAQNAPSIKREGAGFLDALVSDENRQGVEMIAVNTPDGKIKQVQVKYHQRAVDTDITEDDGDSLCEGTETNPLEALVSPTLYAAVRKQFTEAEMRKLCEPDSEWTGNVMRSQFNALNLNIEKQLITKAATLFGAYGGQTVGSVIAAVQVDPGSGYTSAPVVTITGDGTGAEAVAIVVGGEVVEVIITKVGTGYTTATITITGGGGIDADYTATIQATPNSGNATDTVPMLNADGTINAFYWASFLERLADSGVSGTPLLVGANRLAEAMRLLRIGCCNDAGADLSMIGGDVSWYRSRQTGTVLGNANAFIAMEPGTCQLIERFDYVGSYAKSGATFSHGTVTDPWTGIMYDMKAHYNDCDDIWTMAIYKKFDLWTIPADAYAAGDYLRGVNGLFKFIAR